MADVSSSRGTKRNMAASVSGSPSKFSKVTLLSPSLLLLEIPSNANTSLPVWDAIRSQDVDIAWTVNPYSVSVNLTPVTTKQGKDVTPSKMERSSNDLQTSVVASNIQSVPQQHAATQSVSSFLLSFSQNRTQSMSCTLGQPQIMILNPQPSTSIIISLPLIITKTQPACQPSSSSSTTTTTTTKSGTLPAIQTSTTMPTKLQAPSKPPAPSPFHTKTSSDIEICDNFLLNKCHAGTNCKKHHTPYPFHWQLRCTLTHQWVDICPRSQVLLERIYCDVDKEEICITDGHTRYTLNFDSMSVDSPVKYDEARRLTNSDSVFENPFFPSKWKIYWWNTTKWEEYSKNLSPLLLETMREKEPECTFFIDSREYMLDFTTMTQTNVTTRFSRGVRCRPFYRSPDSMHPYLQTGVLTDPIVPPGGPSAGHFNVDPLEEFTSWYPPVWCLPSEVEYSLEDVPVGTRAYQKVKNLFCQSMPVTKVDIISIHQVQNLLHWDKYQRQKVHMQKCHTQSKEPLERHLFHGTTKEASEDICHNNFDPRMSGVNGVSCGFGSYFATSASFSSTYSAPTEQEEVRHMFLAKVLVGKVSLGRNTYRRPPPLSPRKNPYRLYDTCVDSVEKPSMFVVFDSCQCYPYYLIKYKDLPKEIHI